MNITAFHQAEIANAISYAPPSDKPVPLAVSAAVIVTLSLGCWAVILHVVGLI